MPFDKSIHSESAFLYVDLRLSGSHSFFGIPLSSTVSGDLPHHSHWSTQSILFYLPPLEESHTHRKMKDRPRLSRFQAQTDSMRDFSDILPQDSPRSPECVRTLDSIQLTFINNKDDIRWLSAGNAARHRYSIFTGLSLHEQTPITVNSVCRCSTPRDESQSRLFGARSESFSGNR